MKKKIALVLSLVLLVVCTVSATLAWLNDKTQTETNTFTVGEVDIALKETKGNEFQLIPGTEHEKDPTVAVLAGSEACYVYVKVEKANNPDAYLAYSIDSAWTELDATNNPGVYYIEVSAADAAEGQTYPVLTGSKVTVNNNVTNEQLAAIGQNNPTLSFTAYAIQKANTGSALEAWAKIPATLSAYGEITF